MNGWIISYSVAAIMVLLLIYISIFKSNKIQTIFFSLFLFHVFMYILGVAVEISSVDYRQAVIAVYLEYFGICFAIPYFLLTECEFMGYKVKKNWTYVLLFLIPACGFVFVLTYPLNGLFYEKFELIEKAGIRYLSFQSSIFRDLLFGYLGIIFVIASVLIVYTFIKIDRTINKFIDVMVIGIGFPIILLVLYLRNYITDGIECLPLVCSTLCIYYGYKLMYKEGFVTLRFAREHVLDHMKDGYFLCDMKYGYIDANKAAKAIFPFLADCEQGESLTTFHKLPKAMFADSEKDSIIEFCIQLENGENNYYNLKNYVLEKDKKNKFQCWLIYDVTNKIHVKQKLEYAAAHDFLTNIYNRRTFFRLTSDLFLESVRDRISFAVFMLDIDSFKKINDTYGHPNGDKVLINMVNMIKSNIRDKDIFGRYGGEEFVLFLQDIEKEHAYMIAEKIRTYIEKNEIILNQESVFITVSIGVSIYDRTKDDTLEHFIERADKLLYEAKNSGRNKVIVE